MPLVLVLNVCICYICFIRKADFYLILYRRLMTLYCLLKLSFTNVHNGSNTSTLFTKPIWQLIYRKYTYSFFRRSTIENRPSSAYFEIVKLARGPQTQTSLRTRAAGDNPPPPPDFFPEQCPLQIFPRTMFL